LAPAAAALGIALVAAGASAADGDLDPGFGIGGYTLTGVTSASFEIPAKPVVLPDGRILICSIVDDGSGSAEDFFVARLHADGALDDSFDFDGRVTIDFDSHDDTCSAVTAQADGKVLLAGRSEDVVIGNSDFAIARLDGDGSLDPTFGAGTGKVLIPFDVGGTDDDIGTAIAIQPDGKILVAGWADTDTNGDDFALVRLLPDGTRDTTFNSTGRVTVGFDFADSTNRIDQADAIMIEPDERILLGGLAEASPGGFDFALVRLLPNGQLDSDFSADGRATIAFDLGDSRNDVTYESILQRDGKIVMAGTADTGSGGPNLDVAIGRLLPDGSPDPAFGIGGKVVVPFDLTTNGGDFALGVVEDGADRLVLGGVGTYDANSNFHPVALRLLGNGDLDPAFGMFGKKTFDFGATSELFTGVALQGTQIIAAGLALNAPDGDNVVARLAVDLVFADGFD
jgi:uncharacterized delta-60 repeat protein